MKDKMYLKRRQTRIKENYHDAILKKDHKRIYEISKILGLNFSNKQIEDLFKSEEDKKLEV